MPRRRFVSAMRSSVSFFARRVAVCPAQTALLYREAEFRVARDRACGVQQGRSRRPAQRAVPPWKALGQYVKRRVGPG